MLTRLPEVLSIDILSTWCDLETVTKVDSAFCNKMNRWDFQRLLNDITFSSNDSTCRSSKSFWEWIVANGIKVQHMKGMWFDGKCDKLAAKVDCSKVIEFHVCRLEKVDHVVKLINRST